MPRAWLQLFFTLHVFDCLIMCVLPLRQTRITIVGAVAVMLAAACGRGVDSAGEAPLADDAVPLMEGAIRQPIPEGVSPAMVTWRSDGVLIPTPDSLQKTPGYVVDSIFPPEEALRRFQAEAGGVPVTGLADGARSHDALLLQYWSLLAAGDTLALAPLVVSQSEFAYVYYPESDEPSYGLLPNVSWLLLSNNSGRGLVRALSVAQSSTTGVTRSVCAQEPRTVGRNRIHGPCGVVRPRGAGGDTLWIATHIIERDGIFKLMSFTNEL